MQNVVKLGSHVLAVMIVSAALCGTASAGACPPPSVPEIDPGSAVGAMTLLVGGLMTLADKRHAK